MFAGISVTAERRTYGATAQPYRIPAPALAAFGDDKVTSLRQPDIAKILKFG